MRSASVPDLNATKQSRFVATGLDRVASLAMTKFSRPLLAGARGVGLQRADAFGERSRSERDEAIQIRCNRTGSRRFARDDEILTPPAGGRERRGIAARGCVRRAFRRPRPPRLAPSCR